MRLLSESIGRDCPIILPQALLTSPPQLAEHYQHCLKLSAENKVSQKNAFNLQLIDWMAQAIGKKAKKTDGEVDINDFQVSRCPRWDPLTYLS